LRLTGSKQIDSGINGLVKTAKTKKKRLILTINRKGGDNTDRPREEKMLVFLLIAERSAKQSSLVVAMVFLNRKS